MEKHNYLIINGVFCSRYGDPLKGVARYNAEAHFINGGLKQTLDQNKELKDENKRWKEALFYSLSLNYEQGKKIQHLENALESVLPALGVDISRFQ
ncbi:hypothetical protein HpVa122_13050 [Helicobacter pylori]